MRYWLDYSIRVLDWQADWIEARVIDLKKEDGETHSGFWKELLNWYVFNTTCGLNFKATAVLANRALDFAIGITKMDDFGGSHGFIYRSDVLKIIVGRLDREPEIYRDIETPSLKIFLEFVWYKHTNPIRPSMILRWLTSNEWFAASSKWKIGDFCLLSNKFFTNCLIKKGRKDMTSSKKLKSWKTWHFSGKQCGSLGKKQRKQKIIYK